MPGSDDQADLQPTLNTGPLFTPCSSASIVNFEHVVAGWEAYDDNNFVPITVLKIDYLILRLH